MDRCLYDHSCEGAFDAPLNSFQKVLVTWTRVRCSNDDRSLVPVHWHGAEMGSVRGADGGKLLKLYILWQQKKSLPIKANSWVAYKKNRLIWMIQILKHNWLIQCVHLFMPFPPLCDKTTTFILMCWFLKHALRSKESRLSLIPHQVSLRTL